MFEPRATRKSLLQRELMLAFHQALIHFGQRSLGNCCPAVGRSVFKSLAIFRARACQCVGRVVERRKIEKWWHSFLGRRHRLHARIGHRGKYAFFQLAIALDNFIARFLRQRFEFFHISLHGIRKIAEFER